jgi:hypothetical protein
MLIIHHENSGALSVSLVKNILSTAVNIIIKMIALMDLSTILTGIRLTSIRNKADASKRIKLKTF